MPLGGTLRKIQPIKLRDTHDANTVTFHCLHTKDSSLSSGKRNRRVKLKTGADLCVGSSLLISHGKQNRSSDALGLHGYRTFGLIASI